jgi:hypothetical protein
MPGGSPAKGDNKGDPLPIGLLYGEPELCKLFANDEVQPQEQVKIKTQS